MLTTPGKICFKISTFAVGLLLMPALSLTLMLIFLPIATARADTHYAWKNGSNTAPYNTWTTAATTIVSAIDAASAGDIVVVRAQGGPFIEADLYMKPGVDLVAESSAIRPKIMSSWGSSPVITYGETDDFSGSNAASIDGFELTTPGKYGVHVAAKIDSGSAVRNCNIYDFSVAAGICLMPGSNSCALTIEYNVLQGSKAGVYVENAIGTGTDRTTIRYNYISHSAGGGTGVNVAKSSRVTIGPGNVLEENSKSGVIVGYLDSNDNVLITNNKIINTIGTGASLPWTGSGIEVQKGSISEALTIENNVIRSSRLCGVHVKGPYGGELSLTANSIYDNGLPGYVVQPLRSTPPDPPPPQIYPVSTIRQNRIYNNGSSTSREFGSGIAMTRGYGVVENNLIYNNHGPGIRTSWLATDTPEPGLEEISHVTSIMNNTLVGNGKYDDVDSAYPLGAGISNGTAWVAPGPPPTSTFTSPGPIIIRNNVIARNWRAGIRYCFTNTPGAEERDYNLFFDNNAIAPKSPVPLRPDCHRGPEPGSPLQLSCVEHAYANCGTHLQNGTLVLDDPHDIFADPQFVDEENGDYRLKSTSSGHNTGSDGTDMGCYGGTYPMPFIADLTAPAFSGLATATDVGTEGAVDLAWSAATDSTTPITYNIYYSTGSAQQNFASPNATTQSTSYRVTGLASGTAHYFVVRAMDAQENEDDNTVEKSATPTDTRDTTFSGLVTATDAHTSGQISLSWSAASDGSTPITYNIYYSTASGGQNFTTPNTTTIETTYPVMGLTNNTPYYFVVRAEDAYGNEDSNTIEKSATPTSSATNVCPSGCDYTSIQTAINDTAKFPNGTTITVGDGTYNEHLTISRNITVQSQNGAASTIIDGTSNGRVIQFTAGATLDGFTIEYGFLDSGTGTGGAGVYVNNCAPTVKNSIITNNTAQGAAGGGILVVGTSGTPTFDTCTISNNTSGTSSVSKNGGGFYISGSGMSPSIVHCTITNNEASYQGHGGGIYIYSGTPAIDDCTISNNDAGTSGGGIYVNATAATISNSTFSGNSALGATGEGGGLIIAGTGASATITSCSFTGNSAYNGGAVSAAGTSASISRCTFGGSAIGADSNTATFRGGAIMISASTSTINRCAFYFNTAGFQGGGVYWNGGSKTFNMTNSLVIGNKVLTTATNYGGGGLFVGGSTANVTYCTFNENLVDGTSGRGGAIYGYSGQPTIKNSILWGNTATTGTEIYPATGVPTTYSDIQGGYTGTGNINSSPLFVDSGAGDYHLQSGSPCIDTGITMAGDDFDGDTRPQGSGYDMGADEH